MKTYIVCLRPILAKTPSLRKVGIMLLGLFMLLTSSTFAYTGKDLIKGYNHSMALKISPTKKVDTLYKMYRSTYFIDLNLTDSLAQKTLAYAQKINYKRGVARMYIVLAIVNEQLGKLNLTNQFSQKALGILGVLQIKDDLPLAYYVRGTYYRRKKATESALKNYLAGLKIAETTANKRYIRLLNTSIAILQVGEKNYQSALSYHQKALNVAKELNDVIAEQMCYANIGIVYSRIAQYQKALSYHQKALKLALNTKDATLEAYSYNDLGSTYLYLKQYDKAIDYLKKSIALREHMKELTEIAYTYNYLGQVYKNKGDLPKAISWGKKALATAKKIGNTKQEGEAYEELYLTYAHFKKYDSAYVYSHKFHLFGDSIKQIANNENLNEVLISYQTEKKEKENKLLAQKNKLNQLELEARNRRFFTLLMVFLLFVSLALWWLNHSRLNKKQRELSLLKEMQSEKERIARDLHDNVGGQLSYIIYSLDGINNESEETRNEVTESINESVRSVIVSLRETIWAISDANIKISDFSDKLKVFAKSLFKHSSTKVIFNERLEKDRELNALLGLNLYRICQEILNNAFKYAEAEQIIVEIKNDELGFDLIISDNGIGFNTIQKKSKTGYGLSNINKRAEEFGITLLLKSQEGAGVTYQITI